MARNDEAGDRSEREEAGRYRMAAEEALGQLEWCVDYFRSIQKGKIAKTIDKNRKMIQRGLNRTDG